MVSMVNKKNVSIITSISKGAGDRLFVLVTAFVLMLFVLVSAYAIALSFTNPAAWAMLAFFGILFFILLGHEENIFPVLSMRKTPYAVVTLFFTFMFVAYMVSCITNLSLAHGVFATIFGIIVVFSALYVLFPEKRWIAMKHNVKKNTGGRVKKAVKNSRVAKKIKKKKAKKKNKKKKWRLHSY